MPNQSRNGSAFEYAICNSLEASIDEWINRNHRGSKNIQVIRNERYEEISNHFFSLDNILRNQMVAAGKAGWRKILDMEPRLVNATTYDPIQIEVTTNAAGQVGDVRDILFIRRLSNSRRRRQQRSDLVADSNQWEIGISAKWNNEALKNSRLSSEIDFGRLWFDHPCTNQYWQDISVPMGYLESNRGLLFRELPRKTELVYVPTLEAFMAEILRLSNTHPDVPRRLVEYLLGRYDFYQLIGIEGRRTSKIRPINLYGGLNQDCEGVNPAIQIQSYINKFPDRIESARWVTRSRTTIEIVLNHGWQFSMRIHSADTSVIPSLKFDIRFSGNPIETFLENW